MIHSRTIHKTQRGLALTAITLSAWLLLASCQGGLGATRENQYQSARLISKITDVDDILLTRDLDLLPLPDFAGDELSDVGKKITAPTALLAPEILNQITVQSLAGKSWLISPENPSAVWPKLIRFLGRHQITIKRTEPVIGVLESTWFTVSKSAPASEQGRLRQVLAAADTVATTTNTSLAASDESTDASTQVGEDDTTAAVSEADDAATPVDAAAPVDVEPQQDLSLYRVEFKVEQAVKQGFSEIHVSIYQAQVPGFSEAAPDETQATPVTTRQRVALLKVLASDLLQATSGTSVSLLADSINTEPKAELLTEEGQPILLIHLDRSRFYAVVKKSLTSAEITFEVTTATDGSVNTYNIELDRELLTKNQGKLPKGLKGRYHDLELHLSWRQGKGRVLVKTQDALAVPAWYAEQVLTLIREFSA